MKDLEMTGMPIVSGYFGQGVLFAIIVTGTHSSQPNAESLEQFQSK